MSLSLCIATFNEEKNIHHALDTAYDFADEVIIVDGSSTDETVAKVKAYGPKVKVFTESNPPMFHINKQKAIERATGEWILQLDADEELTDDLKEEIRHIANNSEDNSAVAYNIPRKNFFLTRFLMKGGVYPDYTIRLYKKGVAHFPCKDVHENVQVNGKIGFIKNPILHYADPNFGRYLVRWQRYTGLEALKMKGDHYPSSLDFLILQCIDFILVKPITTFFLMFIRHKGFLDGVSGFIFALFSSIRFWVIYFKYLKLKHSP